MIELFNWIADHWFGVLIFGYALFCGVENLIKACRRN